MVGETRITILAYDIGEGYSCAGGTVEVARDMNNRERQKLKYYLYRLKKAYRWFNIEMQVWIRECEQSEKM